MWAHKSNCWPINFAKLGAHMAPKVSTVNHNPVDCVIFFIYFKVHDYKDALFVDYLQ